MRCHVAHVHYTSKNNLYEYIDYIKYVSHLLIYFNVVSVMFT